MRVSPQRLVKFLAKHDVDYSLVAGWDSPAIDPYKGSNDMQGIVLHHTAGMNSLKYIVSGNPYAPVRACHFLVSRTGLVHVVSGSGAYHAGAGGPWKITRTLTIPEDQGNSRLFGIEIESLGTKRKIDGSSASMTVAQVVSTSKLCAALLEAMSPTPGVSFRVGRVIRHRDWTSRKIDVLQDLDWWRAAVRIARSGRGVDAGVRAFVSAHPDGTAQ